MEPQRRTVGQAAWQLIVHEETGSTNDIARALSPWHAVRAERQTAGRGRFGRTFVSDAGGFWISSVVPAEGGPARWNGFSLVIGCHLLRLMTKLTLPDARLRWPNDLMSGPRKVGGILIEQGSGTLIVGLGLNVANTPWQHDPALAATTGRLDDLLLQRLSLDELDTHVLDAIADAHESMEKGGLPPAITELNAHWAATPRHVEITLLEGDTLQGPFGGLDPEGNLRVGPIIVPHNEVGRLREL